MREVIARIVDGSDFAYLLLGEKLQPYHFVGGALILLGIVVIVLKSPPANGTAKPKPATS